MNNAIPAFESYIPHATADQISVMMEALQKVIELVKDEDELAFKLIDSVSKWLHSDSVFPLLLEHKDLHVVHDALDTLERLFEAKCADEVTRVFNDSERLHASLKRIVAAANPDYIKFSKLL